MRTWEDLATDIINVRPHLAGWEHLSPRYSTRSVDGGQNVLLVVWHRGDSSYWAMFAVVEDDLILMGGQADSAAQAMSEADLALANIDPLQPPTPMPENLVLRMQHKLHWEGRVWHPSLVTGTDGVNRKLWRPGSPYGLMFTIRTHKQNTDLDAGTLGSYLFRTEREWFLAVGRWVSYTVAHSLICSPTLDEEKCWLRNLRDQAMQESKLTRDACKADNAVYWRAGEESLLRDDYVPSAPWSYLEFRRKSFKVKSFEHPEKDRKGVEIKVLWEGRLGYRSPETGCQTTWLLDWAEVGDTALTLSVGEMPVWQGLAPWK